MAASLQLAESVPSGAEVVLRLGAEGGSLTRWGSRERDQWLFHFEARDVFGPSARPREVAETWEDAVALLDSRPHWVRLAPLTVHAEFRALVFAAWRARAELVNRPSLRYVASEWEALATDLLPRSPMSGHL